jgi:hypothetical protein
MRLYVEESSMQPNIDDPLIGLLIGQAAIRGLRGKVREGNLDESRLGRPFGQQVVHP